MNGEALRKPPNKILLRHQDTFNILSTVRVRRTKKVNKRPFRGGGEGGEGGGGR